MRAAALAWISPAAWLRMLARALARSPREGHAVQRLSSQALTPQASVHTVRWQGEDLLLGCTAQQVTLLARRPTGPSDGERA
jgi:flagellar biogenesis protein FliO